MLLLSSISPASTKAVCVVSGCALLLWSMAEKRLQVPGLTLLAPLHRQGVLLLP